MGRLGADVIVGLLSKIILTEEGTGCVWGSGLDS